MSTSLVRYDSSSRSSHRTGGRLFACALFLLVVGRMSAEGQTSSTDRLPPRFSVSGGLGVAYVNLRDVVDLINASTLPTSRIPDFRAAGEFSITVDIPLSEMWVIAVEYAYLTSSLTVPSGYGQADFGVTIHMPAAVLQYVLIERGVYNLKAGAGISYLAGRMTEKYLVIDDAYTAAGAGFLGQLEANTALGDHLFAYLSGNFRWAATGAMHNSGGVSPGNGRGGSSATLGFVGVGARIGLSFQF
jgi:hypothetical protein